MSCGKTSAGGWRCEGSGCLDGGRVCMHDAAAARAGPVVSREALGLEPSAADLLAAHHWRLLAAMNDAENRLVERYFVPKGGRCG